MKNRLELKRPIVFFDIESTGTDVRLDRIIEISFLKLSPGNKQEKQTYRVNPGIPIPRETTAIHGITDEDVRDKPSFKDLADVFLNIIDGADLGGYNALRFDIPLLEKEFQRCGRSVDLSDRLVVDPQVIFSRHERRDLASAYRFYCGKEIQEAHTAEADITATVEVLMEQIEAYDDINGDVDSLHAFCNKIDPMFLDKDRRFKWRDGEACCNFGKNKGRKLRWIAENDKNYLHWILKGDFSEEVKTIVREALNGKFPIKKS